MDIFIMLSILLKTQLGKKTINITQEGGLVSGKSYRIQPKPGFTTAHFQESAAEPTDISSAYQLNASSVKPYFDYVQSDSDLWVTFNSEDQSLSVNEFFFNSGGDSLKKATGAQVTTGTDDTAYVTSKAVADSDVLKEGTISQITFPVGDLKAEAPANDSDVANKKYVDDKLGEISGALVYKGTIDASGAASQLADAKVGWFWLVSVAGTLLGKDLKVGDEVFCKTAVTGTPTDFSSFEAIPSQEGILRVANGEVDFLNSIAKNINFGNKTGSSYNAAVKTTGENDVNFGLWLTDYYSNDANGPSVSHIKYRGTVASPTAIQANDLISKFRFSGRGSTTEKVAGDITWKATENWTDSTYASSWILNKWRKSTSSYSNVIEIDENNDATFSDNLIVDKQITIKGGNPGSGKILTSDANGLSSWQTPTQHIDTDVVLERSTIITIGSSTSAFKQITLNVTSAWGTGVNFGGDSNKIIISITPFLTENYDDTFSSNVRSLTFISAGGQNSLSDIIINTCRVDTASSWSLDLKAYITVKRLA